MTLERDKVLRRAENLSIEIRSNNEVDIRSGAGRQVRVGPRALVVLDAFHEPTTFSAALERLSPLIRERRIGWS